MTYQTLNKQLQYPLSGSFTGSLSGTSSYAITASYYLNGGSGGSGNYISTGSVTASVDIINNLFLIKSGNNNYLTIDTTGSLTINTDASNVFLIKNLSNNKNIFTISQSGIITVATSSVVLTGSTSNGSFYFTSSSFFVGLD